MDKLRNYSMRLRARPGLEHYSIPAGIRRSRQLLKDQLTRAHQRLRARDQAEDLGEVRPDHAALNATVIHIPVLNRGGKAVCDPLDRW